MIRKLKQRFIGIAVGAVAAVLLLLCVLVNLGNRLYIEREAAELLEIICDNEGTIPGNLGSSPPGENRGKVPAGGADPEKQQEQEKQQELEKPEEEKKTGEEEKTGEQEEPEEEEKPGEQEGQEGQERQEGKEGKEGQEKPGEREKQEGEPGAEKQPGSGMPPKPGTSSENGKQTDSGVQPGPGNPSETENLPESGTQTDFSASAAPGDQSETENPPESGTRTDSRASSEPGKTPLSGNSPDKQGGSSRFTEETPYATRYFMVRFDGEGTVFKADLSSIAAVTEDELGYYAAEALNTKEGYGKTGDYRYLVRKVGTDRYMAVFLDCHERLRDAGNLIWISAAVALFCTVLVWLAVSLLSGKAMRPYEKNLTMQKQFITDAGHELKTPLTVLGTNLSVLEIEVGKQKWIDASREQIGKMTELVNALVGISRMDEENPPLTRMDFDFSEAVLETAEAFRLPLEKAKHPLVTEVEEQVRYCGDEQLLCRLVSIQLDNALKYAAEGGEVRLKLSRKGNGIRLECSNPCREMDPEEPEHLFDRFYRGDRARSTRGFGIGLSYARSIAEAHGGKMTAVMKDGWITFQTALN